jgi:hypothetical protein
MKQALSAIMSHMMALSSMPRIREIPNGTGTPGPLAGIKQCGRPVHSRHSNGCTQAAKARPITRTSPGQTSPRPGPMAPTTVGIGCPVEGAKEDM